MKQQTTISAIESPVLIDDISYMIVVNSENAEVIGGIPAPSSPPAAQHHGKCMDKNGSNPIKQTMVSVNPHEIDRRGMAGVKVLQWHATLLRLDEQG